MTAGFTSAEGRGGGSGVRGVTGSRGPDMRRSEIRAI